LIRGAGKPNAIHEHGGCALDSKFFGEMHVGIDNSSTCVPINAVPQSGTVDHFFLRADGPRCGVYERGFPEARLIAENIVVELPEETFVLHGEAGRSFGGWASLSVER
jgi:hypothetical protein